VYNIIANNLKSVHALCCTAVYITVWLSSSLDYSVGL